MNGTQYSAAGSTQGAGGVPLKQKLAQLEVRTPIRPLHLRNLTLLFAFF
jgi:hypothetical protein